MRACFVVFWASAFLILVSSCLIAWPAARRLLRYVGFLFDSFKPEACFWETTRLLRKALFCGVVVEIDTMNQALLSNMIIVASLALTASYHPFCHRVVNKLEIIGHVVLIITQSVGLRFFGSELDSKFALYAAPASLLSVSLLVSVVLAYCVAIIAASRTKAKSVEQAPADRAQSDNDLLVSASEEDSQLQAENRALKLAVLLQTEEIKTLKKQ